MRFFLRHLHSRQLVSKVVRKNSLRILSSILLAILIWPFHLFAQSLPAVTGVAYDGEQITWDALDGATGYNIHLDFDYLVTVGNVTSYTPVGSGTYYVVGYNDAGQYSPLEIITSDVVPTSNSVDVGIDPGTDPTVPIQLDSLDAVSNVKYDGENIVWNSLFGATGYNVHYFYHESSGWTYLETVGDVTQYRPHMTGAYLIVGYDNAGNFSPFQIIEGSAIISTNSVTIETLGVSVDNLPRGLAAVTGVAYDGETITWESLEGAAGYNIHLDFDYLLTVGNVTSFVPSQPGEYSVVAYDEQGNYSPIQIIEADVVPTSNSVTVEP